MKVPAASGAKGSLDRPTEPSHGLPHCPGVLFPTISSISSPRALSPSGEWPEASSLFSGTPTKPCSQAGASYPPPLSRQPRQVRRESPEGTQGRLCQAAQLALGKNRFGTGSQVSGSLASGRKEPRGQAVLLEQVPNSKIPDKVLPKVMLPQGRVLRAISARVGPVDCLRVRMCGKSLQLCLTLCDPMDCSPPVSSAHGILQARILEWVAISFSRGSSPPRD